MADAHSSSGDAQQQHSTLAALETLLREYARMMPVADPLCGAPNLVPDGADAKEGGIEGDKDNAGEGDKKKMKQLSREELQDM